MSDLQNVLFNPYSERERETEVGRGMSAWFAARPRGWRQVGGGGGLGRENTAPWEILQIYGF